MQANEQVARFIETILILNKGSIPLLAEHYHRFSATIQQCATSSGSGAGSIEEFEHLLLSALPAQHTAAQHTAAQHTAAQHTAAQHTAAQHTAAQHTAAQHTAAQHTAAQHTATQHTAEKWRCRLLYQADGKIITISIEPFIPRKLERVGIIELASIAYPLKSADRRPFNALRERFPEYDEIIITQNGFLSDSTSCNLYLRTHGGRLLTPAHSLLAGCQQSHLIKKKILHPAPLVWRELHPDWQIGFINALNPLGQLAEIAVAQICCLGLSKP